MTIANIVTSIIFYRICISQARSILLLTIYDGFHRFHCRRCCVYLRHYQFYLHICCYRIAVDLVITTVITVAITITIVVYVAVVVVVAIVVAMISITIAVVVA